VVPVLVPAKRTPRRSATAMVEVVVQHGRGRHVIGIVVVVQD
jgi:hypothetical protein